jgi:hypothetical protein
MAALHGRHDSRGNNIRHAKTKGKERRTLTTSNKKIIAGHGPPRGNHLVSMSIQ